MEDVEEGGGEVGPEELRLLERSEATEVVLGEETDREAGAEAAGAAGPLLCARARDAAEDEPVEPGAGVEAEGPPEARVDDRRDPLDGEGGLGDVRRENDAAASVLRRRERRVLGGARKVAVEDADVEVGPEGLDHLSRPADLGRAREKDEDVSGRALAKGRRDGRGDAYLQRSRVAVGGVPDLDRERAARDRDDGRRAVRVGEEPGDGPRVESGGSDDQEEVGAKRGADLSEHRETEVRVPAPLVELVEHHPGDPGE